ncbi:MAG: hypothetical protein QOH54_3010, partial [Mycobacterium sp.]|nr:hypothetical protein [Mycobacterium sp.]
RGPTFRHPLMLGGYLGKRAVARKLTWRGGAGPVVCRERAAVSGARG